MLHRSFMYKIKYVSVILVMHILFVLFVDDLNRTVVIMLIIYGTGALASMVRAWMFELAGQRFVARLRRNVFAAIIRQEVGFFDENRQVQPKECAHSKYLFF